MYWRQYAAAGVVASYIGLFAHNSPIAEISKIERAMNYIESNGNCTVALDDPITLSCVIDIPESSKKDKYPGFRAVSEMIGGKRAFILTRVRYDSRGRLFYVTEYTDGDVDKSLPVDEKLDSVRDGKFQELPPNLGETELRPFDLNDPEIYLRYQQGYILSLDELLAKIEPKRTKS